jgi:hypothetical protein
MMKFKHGIKFHPTTSNQYIFINEVFQLLNPHNSVRQCYILVKVVIIARPSMSDNGSCALSKQKGQSELFLCLRFRDSFVRFLRKLLVRTDNRLQVFRTEVFASHVTVLSQLIGRHSMASHVIL